MKSLTRPVAYLSALAVAIAAPLSTLIMTTSALAADDIIDIPVPNHSFEVTEGAPVPSWTVGTGSPTANISITDERALDGYHSLLIEEPGLSPGYAHVSSQLFSVEEGGQYQISASIYTTGGNPLASIYARTVNSSGALINSTFTPAPASHNQWNHVTHQFTAPEGAVGVYIWLYTGSNAVGQHFFDDITFSQVVPLTEAVVLNPGFEELTPSGELAHWRQSHGSSAYVSVNEDAEFVRSGDRSLRIHDTTVGIAQGMESNRFPIQPGVHYRGVAHAYRVSGSGQVYLRFYNSSGQVVGNPAATVATPANQWGVAVVDGQAPADAVEATILLYSGSTNQTDTYYDDISVTTAPVTTELIGPQHFGTNAFISAIGERADGQTVGYVGTYGTPAAISEVDLATGEVLRTTPLPGAAGVWGLTVADDGSVYAGTLSNASLYRWQPDDGPAELLGKPVSSESYINWLTAGEDGNIYGGTFPNGHLFKFDPSAGGGFEAAVTDYGQVQPDATYARSVAWHDGKVYVGAGTPAGLIELDPVTDTLRSIPIPSHVPEAEMIYGIETAGAYLSVRTEYPGNLTLFDPATEEWRMIAVSSGLIASPPSSDGLIYFRNEAGGLSSYDLDTKTVADTDVTGIPNTRPMAWADIDAPAYSGETLVWFDNAGNLFNYNPASGEFKRMAITLQGTPVVIHSVGVGNDGLVYTSGYVSGGLTGYNPATDESHEVEGGIHQVDSYLADGSRLWTGVYTKANLWEVDTATGTGGVGSAQRHFELSPHRQDRVMALAKVDERIILGTVAEYGVNGGAITVYDLATDDPEPVVYRDVVQDHAVVSLASDPLSDSPIVYGGTTVDGGLGSTPTSTQGKVFAFNTDTSEKLWEVDGSPGERAVTALVVGPTGTLWGIGVGTLFEMDPNDGTLLRSKRLVDPPATDFVWMGSDLSIGPDGMLYAWAGRQVMQVDPDSLDVVPLIQNTTAYAPDFVGQKLYFARSTDLYSADISALFTDVELSDDSSLVEFYVNGEPLEGFSPDQTEYSMRLRLQDAIPSVRVVASDMQARISVERSATVPGETTVTVTAGDGQSVTVYTLAFELDPDTTVTNLQPPQISGVPEVGESLTSTTGDWDYVGIELKAQWFRDGQPVPGETAFTYAITPADVGSALHVEVTASVVGHDRSTTAASSPLEIPELPGLDLSKDIVEPGETISVTVSGLAVDTEFDLELADGEILGQGTVDAQGQATVTILIPSTLASGAYELVLSTSDGERARATFEVVTSDDPGNGNGGSGDDSDYGNGSDDGADPDDSDGLSGTGSSALATLLVAVLLTMGGIAVVAVRQRQS